ncbi:uncharacterized protein Z518_00121 [Rhinocladiella mackenziei CBS 650.93]|uniref:Cytochrome P450 n=1 Tax=Rhinocladiella mackenziei CBS 650.93 TaxID=1442369 RepID=A0A0D2HEM1_9EURO|nr:uncharacterized protein Z518_00121 [Rhinocladiella mackenziei CBS 650.93]KIX09043.1 hypothetical protein Z518_00121 [Rhinocladiella mackenziei CBS 650.93]
MNASRVAFGNLTNSQQVAIISLSILALALTFWYMYTPRYPDVPTLRVSKKPWIIGTIEDKIMFITNSKELLQIGWERYSSKGINYLINLPLRKHLIMAPQFSEEIRTAPAEFVDNTIANSEITQVAWTIHSRLAWDQFHFKTPIRKTLTESLGPKLPDIVEEAKMCLHEYVGRSKDWTPRKMYTLGFDIVTRTANRLLFGADLARDPEFQRLSIHYTDILFGGAEKVRNLPSFLKPIVMWMATDLYPAQKLAKKILGPIISKRIQDEDRFKADGRQEEWEKVKPFDAIQWVLDVAPPDQRRTDMMVYRMLHINVAAIHTSSSTFLEAFYFLSISPQYHDELREEITKVFRQEGSWTKQALTHLVKLDSFITEALRLCPNAPVKLQRYTIRDWRLSDDSVIPKGNYLWTNYLSLSLDDRTWKDARQFDPWRMYRRRQQEGQANQHQFVMTSSTNLTFGHGKNACPGRFFAANEIKTLMALIIMTYEIRCTNIKDGVNEIIDGGYLNLAKTPIQHPIVEFKYRGDSIPGDIRPLFTQI